MACRGGESDKTDSVIDNTLNPDVSRIKSLLPTFLMDEAFSEPPVTGVSDAVQKWNETQRLLKDKSRAVSSATENKSITISDALNLELGSNPFSLIPTLLMGKFFNSTPAAEKQVDTPASASKGVGTIPDVKEMFNFLSSRRSGLSGTTSSDPRVASLALDQHLIGSSGNLTIAGMAQLAKMNDERKLLIALREMKDQSELLERFSNRQKNAFIYQLSSTRGVDQKILKKYVNNPKAIDDAIETIKTKWSD